MKTRLSGYVHQITMIFLGKPDNLIFQHTHWHINDGPCTRLLNLHQIPMIFPGKPDTQIAIHADWTYARNILITCCWGQGTSTITKQSYEGKYNKTHTKRLCTVPDALENFICWALHVIVMRTVTVLVLQLAHTGTDWPKVLPK